MKPLAPFVSYFNMVNTFLLVLHKVFVNGFVSSGFSRIRRGSLLSLALLAGIGWYALRETNAHENGITGQTQKSTNAGCSCHCSSSSSSTTVTLTASSGYSPLTTEPNTTYDFTITVANSDESDGGCDISTYSGNGLTAGTGLYASNGELTHSSPKSFSGNGYCSWTFTYTTGSTAGWDTIYATGNAVNGDGSDDNGNCDDKWNWAPKFIIHIIEPTKRASLSRELDRAWATSCRSPCCRFSHDRFLWGYHDHDQLKRNEGRLPLLELSDNNEPHDRNRFLRDR